MFLTQGGIPFFIGGKRRLYTPIPYLLYAHAIRTTRAGNFSYPRG